MFFSISSLVNQIIQASTSQICTYLYLFMVWLACWLSNLWPFPLGSKVKWLYKITRRLNFKKEETLFRYSFINIIVWIFYCFIHIFPLLSHFEICIFWWVCDQNSVWQRDFLTLSNQEQLAQVVWRKQHPTKRRHVNEPRDLIRLHIASPPLSPVNTNGLLPGI